jgi:hypothetical protein
MKLAFLSPLPFHLSPSRLLFLWRKLREVLDFIQYSHTTQLVDCTIRGFQTMLDSNAQIQYTNAQIRSILNGLGLRSRIFSSDKNNPNFPFTDDSSPLTDSATKHAIRKFQVEYNLKVDGIVGDATTAKLELVMEILHQQLRKLVNPNFPVNAPFYGPQTIATVKEYQRQLVLKGIATLPLRERLYEDLHGVELSNQPQVTEYYTPAEFRSILNGLGLRSRIFTNDKNNPNFPLTDDSNSLTDNATKHAIRKFQVEYNLVVDGIVGDKTTTKAQEVMRILHYELRKLVAPSFPDNQPFYASQTIAAVKQYQRRLALDGIATLPVREHLYEDSPSVALSNQDEFTPAQS